MSANVVNRAAARSRTQSIVYVAMTVALLAVSAWVSVPLGPVPFTLQTFVLAFALLVLKPSECLAALVCYLALGAVGVPVFSGMRGGIGMLAGGTGGFLWGFLLGAVAAFVLLRALSGGARDGGRSGRAGWVRDFAACLVFLLVSYVCGWMQLMAVAGMGPLPAFLAAIAPFIVPDLAKLAVAVSVAAGVRRAVPALRKARAQR
ncbi:MAG TPA: biotin transporter BioY [Candidatus Aphodovivens avistercoris]|nr:biotin transporter BioY [Candidatus Aphodovivens avistercoris]